jgi:aconitate hydratase
MNLTQKLLKSHLVEGNMQPGEEIGLRIDQTLTQDATGTLVMLEVMRPGTLIAWVRNRLQHSS